ncbi:hypothetical protein C1645_826256 [Glomus cerebriforme]|uniref:Uncharacterized protein n=1 Tax=Glomus cerebriforme TaxID=658196 RepID=A0A397SQR8_9GLOM|nr:hypothetical protein C1645_826256 [Glomus cerebriforme]
MDLSTNYQTWTSVLEANFLKFKWTLEAKIHTYDDRTQINPNAVENVLLLYINQDPSTQRCKDEKHPDREIIQQKISDKHLLRVVVNSTTEPWLIVTFIRCSKNRYWNKNVYYVSPKKDSAFITDKLKKLSVNVNSICQDFELINLNIKPKKYVFEIPTSPINVGNLADRFEVLFRYYEDTDNLAIYLIKVTPGVIDYCEDISDDILISYDHNNKIVSIDIDGISKLISCHMFDVQEFIDEKPPLVPKSVYYEDLDILQVYFIDHNYISCTTKFQKTDTEDIEVEVDDMGNIVSILFNNADKKITKPISEDEREYLAKICEEEAKELTKWSNAIVRAYKI